MKIDWHTIEWGLGGDEYWFSYASNWLPDEHRYLGYYQSYYYGPLSSFGFWYFSISWRLPWTRHDASGGWNIKSKAHRAWLDRARTRADEYRKAKN